jgi:hypothetical protein
MSLLTLELIAKKNADNSNKITMFDVDGQRIRPCPFCIGLELTVRHDPEVDAIFWVHCMDCQSEGPIAPSRRFAVERWQERTPNKSKSTT